MSSKVVWSEQVKNYVNSKAPLPRRAIWREIKQLADWDGRENPPKIKHLEDDLTGYSRLRSQSERIIFTQNFQGGQRIIQCIYAADRHTIYDAFRELFLDELGG
jgi:hypothetical protein